MARVNTSLSGKMKTYFDSVVANAYSDLQGISACAGLKDATEKYKDKTLAQVAEMNHYGAVVMRGDDSWLLPARDFLTAATRDDTERGNYTKELREVIKMAFKEAKPRTISKETTVTGRTIGYGRTHHQTTPFGGSSGSANSARMIMKKIAAQMAQNQRNAIIARDYPSGASHNAVSTIKKKRFDFPMVKSGTLLTKITSWVEVSNGRGIEE